MPCPHYLDWMTYHFTLLRATKHILQTIQQQQTREKFYLPERPEALRENLRRYADAAKVGVGVLSPAF